MNIVYFVFQLEMSLLSPSSYRDFYCPAAHARWRPTLLAKHVEARPFSLLVDESSKNNRKVVNTIAVTAECNVLIDTKVFDMEESIKGESVCEYIQDVMRDCALSPELLIGITRDNASNMSNAIDKLKTEPLYEHVRTCCVQLLCEKELEKAEDETKIARLSCVKKHLTNWDVVCQLQSISALAPALQSAIRVSQSKKFGMSELLLVEQAKCILDDAEALVRMVLRVPPECTNDSDYKNAQEKAIADVKRGAALAIIKWGKRVKRTLELCRHAEIMKPLYWLQNFTEFPVELDEDLTAYGKISRAVRDGVCSDWLSYRRILRDYSTYYRSCDEEDKKALEEKMSDPSSFWMTHRARLPHLSKISQNIFAFCPSSADVERSFKKLRAILPKDHQRDSIKEGTLMRV